MGRQVSGQMVAPLIAFGVGHAEHPELFAFCIRALFRKGYRKSFFVDRFLMPPTSCLRISTKRTKQAQTLCG
jgi:hypothetical protein